MVLLVLLRVVSSTLPLSNERVSSGQFIFFFCNFVVVPNSIEGKYDRPLVLIVYSLMTLSKRVLI